MPRPKRKRSITHPPLMEGFKPFGIPIRDLEPVVLLFEEYEAIRLLDHMGMNQAEAAREMAVSRPTLTRIYEKARRTVAEALVVGKAILIEGGDFQTDDFWYRCDACHRIIVSPDTISVCNGCASGNLRALSAKPDEVVRQEAEAESGGNCICIRCQSRTPHIPGIPCRESRCPSCGKRMIREHGYHHRLIIEKEKPS